VTVLVRVLVVAELELVPTNGFLSSNVDPIDCVDDMVDLRKNIVSFVDRCYTNPGETTFVII